jgi:RNAse (barnase) inhibitor barstar
LTDKNFFDMTYKLNQEAKAFSYTREELFDCVTRIIAHPHKVTTDHDEARAMAIMLVFDDYYSNYTESDNDGSYFVYERDQTDFWQFVKDKLGIDDYDGVDIDEVLK